MAHLFWKCWWKLNGWTFTGAAPFHLKKAIIIVGPHTSWKDLIVGMAARSVLGLHHIKFLGKQELFKGPLGWVLRVAGGTPVDRKKKQGTVAVAVRMFNENEQFILALSPEGTRKRVDRLRTGFYYIAKEAGVPIVMIGLDFSKRQLMISEPFFVSNDCEKDFNRIHSFFISVKGRYPDQGLQHFKPNAGRSYSRRSVLYRS